MNQNKILKLYFDIFSEEDDVFSEDWVLDHVAAQQDELDVVFSGQTNSGNPACGDEAETIYEQSEGGHSFFFVESSTGGFRGPFIDLNDSIRALGYNPDRFDIEYGPFDPESECPDAECPFCGKMDSQQTCEHHIATIDDDKIEGGLLDGERGKTWAAWIEKALTKGKELGVKPIGMSSASSLDQLSRAAKTRSHQRPYRVYPWNCGGVVRDLLEKSDVLMKERYFFNGRQGPDRFLDFYSKDPDQLAEQCEERLRKWLELPDSGNK